MTFAPAVAGARTVGNGFCRGEVRLFPYHDAGDALPQPRDPLA